MQFGKRRVLFCARRVSDGCDSTDDEVGRSSRSQWQASPLFFFLPPVSVIALSLYLRPHFLSKKKKKTTFVYSNIKTNKIYSNIYYFLFQSSRFFFLFFFSVHHFSIDEITPRCVFWQPRPKFTSLCYFHQT